VTKSVWNVEAVVDRGVMKFHLGTALLLVETANDANIIPDHVAVL
jgi:hypothetical protein